MAAHDAEINIGVNLDADQFNSAFNNEINKVSQDTQTHIQGIFDDMKGAAAKSWQTLPFAAMHDPTIGNQVASQAFVASMAEDLKRQGIKRGTLGYQSALLSAAMKSTTPDPMDRYHRMLAEGMYYQADEVHPTTALSRAIESNYALMEQDWAKDFVKTKSSRGFSAKQLNKLSVSDLKAQAKAQGIKGFSTMRKADLINALVQKSKSTTQIVDFAGMRDYAVEHGLGRWIDPDKEHTADNFELINKELEKIDKNSDKSGKTFRDWSDTLKTTLGTLTAIGGVLGSFAGTALGAAIAFDKRAEKGNAEAATTLDRRRGFVGMNALDELSAQIAGQSIGLGKNAITNEVLTMSSNREKYKLLGEGLNALYPALTGIFDNIMGAENPLDAYKSILTEVYGQMQGADDETKARTLMLLENQGLGSAAQIIGAFLSNPKLAEELGNDPTALFNLRNNKYYGNYERAETTLPDLTALNASIKTSYGQLYTDWMTEFGKPFREWWDNTLQEVVVPWAEKLMRRIKHKETAQDMAENATVELMYTTLGRVDARAEAIRNNDVPYIGYVPRTGGLGVKQWTNWISGDVTQRGRAARAVWDFYDRIAKTTDEEINAIDPDNKAWQQGTKSVRERVKYMRKRLSDTGLDTFLEDTKSDYIDQQLLRAMQMGAYGGANWQENFDSYIERVISKANVSDIDEKIYEVLEKIAQNTEVAQAFTGMEDPWIFIANLVGSDKAAEMRQSLTTVNRAN